MMFFSIPEVPLHFNFQIEGTFTLYILDNQSDIVEFIFFALVDLMGNQKSLIFPEARRNLLPFEIEWLISLSYKILEALVCI